MKKPLFAALTVGIIAALLTMLYLNSLELAYKKGTEKVTVLAARQYINQGSMLDDSQVEEILVPRDYLQPKVLRALKDLRNADGKKIYMTLVPVEKGEQILTTKLSMLGLDTGISAIIPNDRRAITLVVDGSTISGIIKPGNRIDIIGIFAYEDRDGRMQEGAFTILQNILVLAVGNNFLGMPKASARSREQGKDALMMDPPSEGSIPVSFALTPGEAEILALASEKGSVKFSLRPLGDDSSSDYSGTRMRDICRDLSATIKNAAPGSPAAQESYGKELKQQQKEVIDLLKKYRK